MELTPRQQGFAPATITFSDGAYGGQCAMSDLPGNAFVLAEGGAAFDPAARRRNVEAADDTGCAVANGHSESLIKPFRSIDAFGKWPYNRLLGWVIATLLAGCQVCNLPTFRQSGSPSNRRGSEDFRADYHFWQLPGAAGAFSLYYERVF